MKQLTIIACSYGSASALAAGLGAQMEMVILIVFGGLAHAALASWFGIQRGAQHPERPRNRDEDDEPRPPDQISA
jgi:hypothetical protein